MWRLIAAVSVLHKFWNYPPDDPGKPRRVGEPSQRGEPGRLGLPIKPERWHPEEKEHRRKERQFWRFSVGLAGFATGAAVIGAIFAYFALKASMEQATTAQKALIAADRPWLKVTDLSHITVDVEREFVLFVPVVKVKNIGHSPAQHIYVDALAISDSSIGEQNSGAVDICREAASATHPAAENLIFPDDASELSGNAAIAISAIRQKINARAQRESGISRSLINRDVKQPIFSDFTIVGCITYNSPSQNILGQTAFVFDLDKSCNFPTRAACTFDLSHPAIYTEPDILIRRPGGGIYAR